MRHADIIKIIPKKKCGWQIQIAGLVLGEEENIEKAIDLAKKSPYGLLIHVWGEQEFASRNPQESTLKL